MMGKPYPRPSPPVETFSVSRYWVPKYWRNRSVSVISHVFCSSISTNCSLPAASFIRAEKSMRNSEMRVWLRLVYSWRRIFRSRTSCFNRADSNTLAARSSSIRNLNTESYIGLAMIVIIFYGLVTPANIAIIIGTPKE